MPLEITTKKTPYQVLTRFLLSRQGYLEGVVQDCKGLFLYRSEVYVKLRRHTKE